MVYRDYGEMAASAEREVEAVRERLTQKHSERREALERNDAQAVNTAWEEIRQIEEQLKCALEDAADAEHFAQKGEALNREQLIL